MKKYNNPFKDKLVFSFYLPVLIPYGPISSNILTFPSKTLLYIPYSDSYSRIQKYINCDIITIYTTFSISRVYVPKTQDNKISFIRDKQNFIKL